MRFRLLLLTTCLSLTFAASSFAQKNDEDRSWNQPVEPFNIAANLYYVGASDITSYLITTPKGHILIDSGFIETVPQISRNIAKLGFRLSDVKILLNSHPHYDHAGGLAELKRLTNARLMISKPDFVLLANGGKRDPNFADRFPFEAIKADETFGDGQMVKLGGTVLKANITPGHTRGCTTWTTVIKEKSREYNVIFVCSTSAPGYKLIDNDKHPSIFEDYQRTFERLERMKVDIFLGSHGNIYHLQEKIERRRSTAGDNPFIDPAGYRDYLAASKAAIQNTHKRQSEAKK